MCKEVWKYIEGYEGRYEISNKGRVRSWLNNAGNRTDEPRILKKSITNKYYHVTIYDSDRNYWRSKISRLVANAFIPNPGNKPEVNHIDGNKLNDKVSNLEWVTSSENIQHAIKEGLLTFDHLRGENNYRSKLTKKDVLDIRNAYRLGCFTQREIADAYDMPAPAISRIINRKRWKHI